MQQTHTGSPWWLLLLLPAFPGCLEELPSPSKIEGLRIIGVRAQPPEAAEGESVTLSALVVDGQNRDIRLTWLACLKPERGSGFFAGSTNAGASGGGGYGLSDPGSCFELQDALDRYPDARPIIDLMPLGSDPEVRLQVPAGLVSDPEVVAQLYGLPSDTPLPLPILALFTSIAGVNLTVGLRAEVDGDAVEAFKRVNVSTGTPKNTNPRNLRFALAQEGSGGDSDEAAGVEGEPSRLGKCFGAEEDTVPVTLSPGVFVIRAQNVPDPYEKYSVILGSTDPESPFAIQEKEEVYFYSMFSTIGTFGDRVFKSRGDAQTTWDVPSDLPATVPLWIVARDGRGGTTWCHSELVRAEPLVP